MSYIDPEGMFGGDRMAMLSDKARWAWPWFWVASNDAGRIELSYRKVVDRAFGNWDVTKRPTEKQFFAWMNEYRDCWLLFIYDSEDGKRWGQWDVPERFLPRFRKRADQESPAPMAREFVDWRAGYRLAKRNRAIEKSCISNVGTSEPSLSGQPDKHRTREQKKKTVSGHAEDQLSVNDCSLPLSDPETIGHVRTHPSADQDKFVPGAYIHDNGNGINGSLSGHVNSREITIDKDNDIDIDTKTLCPPSVGGHAVVRKKRTTRTSVDSWVIEQHDQWYAGFWNRQKKQRSLDAYARRIAVLITSGMSREVAAEFLRERCADDRRRFEPTTDWSWRCNLHPTTWLNQERWTDEAKALELNGNGNRPMIVPTATDQRRSETLAVLDAIDKIKGRA